MAHTYRDGARTFFTSGRTSSYGRNGKPFVKRLARRKQRQSHVKILKEALADYEDACRTWDEEYLRHCEEMEDLAYQESFCDMFEDEDLEFDSDQEEQYLENQDYGWDYYDPYYDPWDYAESIERGYSWQECPRTSLEHILWDLSMEEIEKLQVELETLLKALPSLTQNDALLDFAVKSLHSSPFMVESCTEEARNFIETVAQQFRNRLSNIHAPMEAAE